VAFADDKGFNGKISQCIDRALDTFGEGVKESLYYQIKKQYNVPKEQFVSKPAEIIEDLEKFLGATGSKFVERLVVREIGKSFGIRFGENTSLSTAINEAQNKFLDATDSN
jgi:hypothetical protein